MNKSELLKELRALTQAGMKDCNDALKEAGDDLQKAVDIIKTKGQNIVSGREGKIAAEGIVLAGPVQLPVGSKAVLMLEVNCETDFVARSPEFRGFAEEVWFSIAAVHVVGLPFDKLTNGEALTAQTELSAKVKEKCVFNRWWIEEPIDDTCRVFGYVHHPADKLASIVTLKAPSVEIANSEAFAQIGYDLAMQIVAMNPIAISPDKLPEDVLNRQKDIFQAQVEGLGKPQVQWARIIEGKLNKWYTEVCLTKQESVVVPKKSIEQLIDTQYAAQLGGKIEIVNFIRCQVGEGIEQQTKGNFSDEVAKLSGVPATPDPNFEKGVLNNSNFEWRDK
jgi:elongation factor Ts